VVRKLNNEAVVEQLVAQIFSRTDGPRKILVDFGPVEVISSAGLRKLITLQRSILATGRQLRLCCANPQVYGTFVGTRLNQILNVYPDLGAAMEGYS
jgi:anti-anti-sigma factor